jgi:hypothetical protein
MPAHQLRDHAVPCFACGVVKVHGCLSARTMTWNISGKCNAHEELAAQVAKRAKVLHGV